VRNALFAVLLLAAPAAQALSLATGGPGTSGADFLTVGVGARALAMGGAFTAVDTDMDANAINWNPAGLGRIEQRGVSASYNSLFQDENQGFLGYARPLKSGGVMATGLNYLIVSNIERRSGDTENPDSTFSNQNYAFNVSYARALGDSVSLGGNLKYIRTQLDAVKSNAMGADFGLLARTPVDGLTAGAAIRNLGTDIGPDPLPLTLQGGVAYKLLGPRLLLASDVQWLETERRAYVSLGSEYWISRNLAARAGYQFGHAADQLQNRLVGLGVGVGVRLGRFTMDYAFMPYGDLGNTHRVTLGLRFR
jgi:hypothetical protein